MSTMINQPEQTISIRSHDHRAFDASLVLPEAGRGPGIALFQEIFGVNDFLLGKARDLSELGYVVCCPDVFWRVEPGVSLPHDDLGLSRGMTVAGRWTQEIPDPTKVSDIVAVLEQVRARPEVSGPVGVMGYCLGGTLAYLLAANGSPDACVSYYGSGIAAKLDLAQRVTCPVLFHFGGKDSYIPNEQVD
ncbi:MAG: dienelactone hydrolase family protein, partial [Acidimicrobiales bacterium]